MTTTQRPQQFALRVKGGFEEDLLHIDEHPPELVDAAMAETKSKIKSAGVEEILERCDWIFALS